MAIIKSKSKHLWDVAYKTIISKVKGKHTPPISWSNLVDEIATNYPIVEIYTVEFPIVTEEKIIEAAKIVENEWLE